MSVQEQNRQDSQITAPRRWSMLGLGVLAQAAGGVFANAPAFLIPTLHDAQGMSLARAGLNAGCWPSDSAPPPSRVPRPPH